MQAARPFITLRNATFRLGDRLIFENSSWIFRSDEHWAIVGQNASGKSLLGDGICGRLPLVGGELIYHFGTAPKPTLKGEPRQRPNPLLAEDLIAHVSFDDRKREIHGTVLQSRWNSLEEGSLTVSEFLSYDRVMEVNPYAVNLGESRQRHAFQSRQARVYKLLSIERFRDHALLSLSNGERQRVELARALCRPLRLLVLDEPFTGLDSRSREELRSVLNQLMGTRLRILLITTRLADLPRNITHVLEVSGCTLKDSGKHVTRQMLEPRGDSKLQLSNDYSPQASAMQPHQEAGGGGVQRGSDKARDPVLQLRDVTVRYGRSVLLSRVNWTVYPGESWVLLGPNGSGKSTLLSLITGDNPQVFNNEVFVFGKRRGTGESLWDLKRQIGYVSPELHLHFDAAISCLLAVASGFSGTVGIFEAPTWKQLKAAKLALKEFDLQQQAESPLFALSTGLQRMVLLARALINNPRLLVMDEPCQGLDAEHRRRFLSKVDRIVRQQLTSLIYVSHRQDEVPPSVRNVFRLGK